MYTELTSIEEIKGKTVQSITCALDGDQMVIAFTDHTFLPLGIMHDYDDVHWVALQEFDFMNFGAHNLIVSGIIGEAERGQKVAEHHAERRRGYEAVERRRYEQLKARFE